jgi:EAL domain-containing protein (putative c-di-GMP-specific phosphodiesterase class I)
LPPIEFIPLAEEIGLMGPLSHWVLNAALQQCQEWQRAGIHLPVVVNISIRNLRDPQLPDTVAELLDTYGLPHDLLCLEFAERAVGEHFERAAPIIDQLRALGVSIGIDDFGTGCTSRADLERLAPDELKVDRSFVTNMIQDRHRAAVVQLAVELGHHLGVRVAAEGVSDEDTRALLARLGCDLAQGYHLARPMTAVDLLLWLARQPRAHRRRTAPPRRRPGARRRR